MSGLETKMAEYAYELVQILPHIPREQLPKVTEIMKESMKQIIECDKIGEWTEKIYEKDSIKNRVILTLSLITEIGFDPRFHMVLRDDGTYGFDGLFLFSLMPKIDQLAEYNKKLRG